MAQEQCNPTLQQENALLISLHLQRCLAMQTTADTADEFMCASPGSLVANLRMCQHCWRWTSKRKQPCAGTLLKMLSLL